MDAQHYELEVSFDAGTFLPFGYPPVEYKTIEEAQKAREEEVLLFSRIFGKVGEWRIVLVTVSRVVLV